MQSMLQAGAPLRLQVPEALHGVPAESVHLVVCIDVVLALLQAGVGSLTIRLYILHGFERVLAEPFPTQATTVSCRKKSAKSAGCQVPPTPAKGRKLFAVSAL